MDQKSKALAVGGESEGPHWKGGLGSRGLTNLELSDRMLAFLYDGSCGQKKQFVNRN